MDIFSVEVLSYDESSKTYTVRYCVDHGGGVMRRTKAEYKDSCLSRDSDKVGLLEEVKSKVAAFNPRFA